MNAVTSFKSVALKENQFLTVFYISAQRFLG